MMLARLTKHLTQRTIDSMDELTKRIWEQHKYLTETLPKLKNNGEYAQEFGEPWMVTPDDERINALEDSITIDWKQPF